MTVGRLTRLREGVRDRFWLVPAMCCVTAVALGWVLPEVDEVVADYVPFIFTGGPAGARSLLTAITTSMISVTGLVFSITVVVMQLASSQFSPRVLRSFLRSGVTQLTLGVFTATFLYAIVVLRSVRGDDDVDAFVPQLAITGAFLLVLASVAMFLHYIEHITQSIRVSTIIGNVGSETRTAIARVLSHDEPSGEVPVFGEPPPRTVTAGASGVLTRIDVDALVRWAERHGVVVEVLHSIGDHVVAGMPLLAVHGSAGGADADGADDADDADDDDARRAVSLARERSMEQDIDFGIRQLVDIAERALSPSVNDPTTAAQVLDELHDLLRRLATAPDPPRVHTDGDGAVRLVLRVPRFGDHLSLALQEILQYGDDALQVQRRAAALLDDLAAAARPEHRQAVQEQRRRWAADD